MDVDVDTPSSFNALKVFPTAIRASMYRDQKLTPHQCGVYFQTIPTDPITGLAAIPYEDAEAIGAFKVDFLHVSVYDHFSSREEITELLKIDPDWTLLKIPSVVKQLFQLSKHYETISKVQPQNLMELADVLALIRPQKSYLMEYYLKDTERARKMLYSRDAAEGYAFKKAHAVAYAMVIVLQLHLIKGGVSF